LSLQNLVFLGLLEKEFLFLLARWVEETYFGLFYCSPRYLSTKVAIAGASILQRIWVRTTNQISAIFLGLNFDTIYFVYAMKIRVIVQLLPSLAC